MSDEVNKATEIVFDLIKLRRINPWDVNISGILKQLAKEIREKGYLQFTLSGLILLASSIIYLRKTETLLSIESELKRDENRRAEETLDIPLDLLEKINPLEVHLRPSQPFIDLEGLAKALLEILEKTYSKKPSEEESLPPIVPQPDDFIREIERKVEEFRNILLKTINQQGRVSVNSLLEGKHPLEMARTFILILFLLSEQGFDVILQDGEYYIVMENGF